MGVRDLVDRIVADGVVTEAERLELERTVCEDPDLSDEEREQIVRLRDLIARGEVSISRD
jgi:hypothetical protein